LPVTDVVHKSYLGCHDKHLDKRWQRHTCAHYEQDNKQGKSHVTQHDTGDPYAYNQTVRTVLWIIVLLSLLPAFGLAVRRSHVEGRSRTVTLLMDEVALAEQADYLGLTSFELAQRYRALGLSGIALYEETFESLAAEGDIALRFGDEVRSSMLAQGDVVDVPGSSTLISNLAADEDTFATILAKNAPDAQEVTLANRTWYWYPGDGRTRPASVIGEQVQTWSEAGWTIAYRPRNFPGLRHVGEDFPAEASYLIHASVEVAGNPNGLDDLVAASQDYLTGVIEGTEQDGMEDIIGRVPNTRVFGINQDWLNTLEPAEVVSKYLLAANERGARLLYVRPYTKETMGDMFANTETLVGGLVTNLQRDGFTVGEVGSLEYDSVPLWRNLSAVGIVAGLLLFATLYPGLWGAFMALAVLGLGVVAGSGFNWDALALVAALIFPILGYGMLPSRVWALPVATLISLAGALLLAAVGSDTQSMLAAEPFAGVAATLLVPPVLFLLHYALRFHSAAGWIRHVWGYRIRLGDVIIVFVGMIALALVFLRRGNFPAIAATDAELALRDWLAERFVRPRFKELLGHPLAVLALGNSHWAAWVRGLGLTGGVIAQATILNSFSHYHTPLLISLERTLVALVLGSLLGFIGLPVSRWVVALVARWLRHDASSEPNADSTNPTHAEADMPLESLSRQS
jgi:hypothetical protein